MDKQAAAAHPLLAALKAKDRDRVLRSARERTYQPGDIVVAEGDPATHLYLVMEGTARVERPAVGVVGRLGPGDFFGELALIEEHPRTATIVADTTLNCLLISAWEFKKLLDDHPEMAVPMLKAILARIHAREGHGH